MNPVNPKFDVQVGRSKEPDHSLGAPGAAFVSAGDLAVPSRARKEVDKAVELMRKRELEPAIQRLHKAIAIYPPYAVAYNNLGVIYSRLGDLERERVALQKAVDLNDHYELAYVNLGRMDNGSDGLSRADLAVLCGVHAAALRSDGRDQSQGACTGEAARVCASHSGAGA